MTDGLHTALFPGGAASQPRVPVTKSTGCIRSSSSKTSYPGSQAKAHWLPSLCLLLGCPGDCGFWVSTEPMDPTGPAEPTAVDTSLPTPRDLVQATHRLLVKCSKIVRTSKKKKKKSSILLRVAAIAVRPKALHHMLLCLPGNTYHHQVLLPSTLGILPRQQSLKWGNNPAGSTHTHTQTDVQ